MLAEIQVNKSTCKVFALDSDYKVMAVFPCSCEFYPGTNEYGQERGNAEEGVYTAPMVWCEAKGPEYADEPAYGWGYINIDERGRALHGGGSNLGVPDCYDPFQPLLPTLGCFRMHNADVYYLALLYQEAVSKGRCPCVHVVE